MSETIDETRAVVRQREPLDTDPLRDELIKAYSTAQDMLYVPSRGRLTLAGLRARCPERRLVAAMQCAGNRQIDDILSVMEE